MKTQLIKLTPEYDIKPFDCEDDDLNGFLLETDSSIPNARHHTVELLAVTYLIEDLDANQTIAYFSLLNDKIEREITDTNAWNRLSRKLPNIKRRSSHPSVKVGRLAVSKKYQGQNWGKQILSFLKEWFTHGNKTGCRYITVDALRTAMEFYEKSDFKVLVTPKDNDDTVLMYYDLKQFVSK